MTKVKHPHSRAERRRLSEKKKARSYTARPNGHAQRDAPQESERSAKEEFFSDSENFRTDDISGQSLTYAIRNGEYPR